MKKKVVGGVPGKILGMMADLSHKLQHGTITEEEFALFLQRKNPFRSDAYTQTFSGDVSLAYEWQSFFKNVFPELPLDFDGIRIPDDPGGFDRVLIVPQGLIPGRALKACDDRFPVFFMNRGRLGAKFIKNERNPKNKSYAIRVRDRVEADKEMRNKSADDVKLEGIPAITLLECLILELKFYDETGGHLDLRSSTICAGSRLRGSGYMQKGCAPSVGRGNHPSDMFHITPEFCNEPIYYSSVRVVITA